MRIFCLIGMLLALSGCANERSIVFLYYPNHPAREYDPNNPAGQFPPPSEFALEAQKECGKYGLIAVHEWDSWTDWQRVRSSWRCVQP